MSLSTRRLSARTVREAGGAETLRELAALIDAAAGSCVVPPLTDQRTAAILACFAITTPGHVHRSGTTKVTHAGPAGSGAGGSIPNFTEHLDAIRPSTLNFLLATLLGRVHSNQI